jgi:uncharacterized membrane protein
MLFVLMIAGAILAVVVFEKFEFFLLGAFLGFVVWRMNKLSAEIKGLKNKFSDLNISSKTEVSSTPQPETVSKAAVEDSLQIPLPEEPATEPLNQPSLADAIAPQQYEEADGPDVQQEQASPQPHSRKESQQSSTSSTRKAAQSAAIFDKIVQYVKDYFTQGNVVVRVGAVILFFGVAFLLKYAAENSNISMETRLFSVAVAAIALLAFGWRLRDKKQGYGLILQGTAIGVLYITLFVSLRLYSLLPAGFVFSMMFLFSGFAMLLAILQNSHSLAVLSITGGFLAPVLTSTGSGNHVALFSYYAILNLGIFGVAWYRSWRLLNLIGFAFTFIIGSAWGVMNYEEQNFATTEPFLILFFLLYSAIALLFSIKQKPVLKGYVDSTLIFGLPIICFTLQAAMVNSYEFGLAWSAFALGAFYLGCAFLVLRGNNKNIKIIAEAYLALGIIFVSLVIPFALDGQWTSASWAIEGGGLIWLGLRQNRWFPKYFGALIQLGGGLLFLNEIERYGLGKSVIDSNLLGIVLVSMAAIFSSYQIWKNRQKLPTIEAQSYIVFLIWGLCWWYFGGFAEVDQHLSGTLNETSGWLIFLSLSGLTGYFLETYLKWSALNKVSWITFTGLFVAGLAYFLSGYTQSKFFSSWISIIWLFSITSFYWCIYQRERVVDLQISRQKNQMALSPKLHFVSLLSVVLLSIIILHWSIRFLGFTSTSWSLSLYAVLASGWLWFLSKKQLWPIRLYLNTYSNLGQKVILVGALLWSIGFNFPNPGLPQPLTYLPFLNPLDIAQGMLLLLAYYSIRSSKIDGRIFNASLFRMGLAVFVFVWLNVMLLRSIHAWVHIPYDLDRMFASNLVQTSLSIFWTVIGLAGTILGNRTESRKTWIYAAGLIGVVVIKLFSIDLANSSSIERIVSFLVVGILLLTVGYFSPLPATESAQNDK